MINKDYDIFIIGGSASIAGHIIKKFSKTSKVFVVSRKKENKNKNCKWIKIKSYKPKEVAQIIFKNKEKKKIAILFLNGISDSKPFYYLKTKEISKIIYVNYILPLSITKEILLKMFDIEIKFIFSSTTRARNGDIGITVYSSSKAGLVNSIKSLSLEYGNLKKFFYVISMGIFKTGLIKKIPISKVEKIKDRSAIKDFVEFDDLNNCIDLILKNNSLSGSIIYCDNGYR